MRSLRIPVRDEEGLNRLLVESNQARNISRKPPICIYPSLSAQEIEVMKIRSPKEPTSARGDDAKLRPTLSPSR